MRTPTDALRSLKRYVAESLGSEWEVRLAGEDGTFKRPFARVGAAAGFRTRPIGGAMQFEIVQPFSIVCHPVETATADEAVLEAARVQMLLTTAFSIGTHAPSYRVIGSAATDDMVAVNISRGHPLRIPLYDYDGIALTEAAGALDRDSRDFMRVTGDVSADVVTDPNDDLKRAVTAAATMSWAVSAAVLSPAMTVREVTAEGEGS